MKTDTASPTPTPNLFLHGFMSALIGVGLMFSVLMVSRGFVFDWVTYFFLIFGCATGVVTFFLTDYKHFKTLNASENQSL
jgi:hypothetical protein